MFGKYLVFFSRMLLLAVLLAATSVFLPSADAESKTPASPGSKIPLTQVLNPDGTINPQNALEGSFDLSGWQGSLDPVRGPVFTPAVSVSDVWSPVANGVNDSVMAVALAGNDLYVGGYFTQPCPNNDCGIMNQVIYHIARWNGSTWASLGEGLDGVVNDIVIDGTDVYVGGTFTLVCGFSSCSMNNTPVNHIAKWNGNSWTPLGNGLNEAVETIALYGNDVYVGGAFTHACGNVECSSGNVPVNHIARWDGSAWFAVGNGVNAQVDVIARNGSDVYVGGTFSEFCDNPSCNGSNVPVNHIAKWNGTAWSAVGNGFNEYVAAIVFDGNRIYAGGGFRQVCGNPECDSGNIPVNHVAVWDASAWAALGNGVSAPVQAMALRAGEVFVGGGFDQVCGDPACLNDNRIVNSIAVWNGDDWLALGNGVFYGVNDMWVDGSDVYVVGGLSVVCGEPGCGDGNLKVNHIAKYGPPDPPTDNCTAKPSKPILKSPINNVTLPKNFAKLKWRAATCAVTYNVIVQYSNWFTVDKAVNLKKLKYKTIPLPHNYGLKWSVSACNSRGCTKSAKGKFTTP